MTNNAIQTYRTKENGQSKEQIKTSTTLTENTNQTIEKQIEAGIKEDTEISSYHLQTLQTKKQQERDKTRLATLNGYSIRYKQTAVEHFLRDNSVHIAVITETHVQEGGGTRTKTKGLHISEHMP